MKFAFLLFLIFTSMVKIVGAQNRDTVVRMWEDPVPFLDKISNDIKAGDSSWEGDKRLADQIQGLAYAINQEIISATSTDWDHPSRERLQVIDKWGQILDPYIGELIVVAMEERKIRERSSTQARSILDFASPTEEFESKVRSYLAEEKPETAGVAALLLYEHRLLVEKDIDVLSSSIMSSTKPENQPQALMSLSYYGATKGTEVARETLRSEVQSNDPAVLINHYRGALELIENLGPSAESLLPEIDALASRIESSELRGPGAGLLHKLKYARDLVTGIQSMPARSAKNGSGPLPSKLGAVPQRRQKIENSTPTLKPRGTPGGSSAISESGERGFSKGVSAWLSILTIVMIAAVIAGVVIQLKRSSR